MAVTSHLRALQALELAVRTGSMKEAAKELGITPAAVGQRIKTLEDYLGLDLLLRGRSGIRPTRELEKAVSHLGAAFRELETVSSILDFQRVHEIHITSDADWAELWLKPKLAKFKSENPNTMFCINGVGDVPMRLGQADCEIWFGEQGNSDTEFPLFKDYLLPVSSPENTHRISTLAEFERLEGFPLLHLDCYNLDPQSIGWPDWINKYGFRETAPDRGIRYKHVVHALEAVYSNAGLIICGLALILEKLNQQKLSLPFPVAHGAWSGHGYNVRFSTNALRRNQTERFKDWLLAQSELTRERLMQQVDC